MFIDSDHHICFLYKLTHFSVFNKSVANVHSCQHFAVNVNLLEKFLLYLHKIKQGVKQAIHWWITFPNFKI